MSEYPAGDCFGLVPLGNAVVRRLVNDDHVQWSVGERDNLLPDDAHFSKTKTTR